MLHLQCRSCYATGVGRLAGTVSNLCVKEDLDAFRSGRHVGAFTHSDAAILNQQRGIRSVDLILGCRRHRDLTGDLPDVALGNVLGVLAVLSVILDPAALNLFQLLQQLQINTFFIIDITVRIRAGHNLATELVNLLGRVDRNIP